MVTPSLADIANAGRDLAAIDGREHGGRGVSLWETAGASVRTIRTSPGTVN